MSCIVVCHPHLHALCRRSRRPNPVLIAAAAIAVFCLGAVVHYGSTTSPYGRSDALVSVDGLGKEAKEFQKIESTVRNEMNQNQDLTTKFHGTFGGSSDDMEGVSTPDSSQCHCNCKNSNRKMKVKAATMLAQVGEVRPSSYSSHTNFALFFHHEDKRASLHSFVHVPERLCVCCRMSSSAHAEVAPACACPIWTPLSSSSLMR
jgi:hypothetical protein